MPTNHRRLAGPAATLFALLAASAAAPAQTTARVSVDAAGVEGNDQSGGHDTGESAAISADNRYVAFQSLASNLVAGDTNGRFDIFVKELATGVIVRVSVDSAGVQNNKDCTYPTLSADGRFVAFTSLADNLVAGDTNLTWDNFLHDRDPDANGIFDEGNGVTTRVSVSSNGAQANRASDYPMVSADGSTVVFSSFATNLISNDTNLQADVFAYDRLSAKTTLLSTDSAGNQADDACYQAAVSADGQVVAFVGMASNLVAGDTNATQDVFVKDRTSGQTTRVSVDSAGTEANTWSEVPALSADGSLVSFKTLADNLVAGDTNAAVDVFVHERSSGKTMRVSVDSAGAEANGESSCAVLALSASGRFVVFDSFASNLVAGDSNLVQDVFVRDLKTATTTRVSVTTSGKEGDSASYFGGISADGELVTFSSTATNMVANDTNGQEDVFVRNRCVAIASSYGAGWPGTFGTPGFLTSGDPVLGTSFTVTISNSLGADTPGLLLIGVAEANLLTPKGGTLLVAPLMFVPLLIHTAGESLKGSFPNDPALCGVAVDLQALELDAGASKGYSFTAGLKLLLGF